MTGNGAAVLGDESQRWQAVGFGPNPSQVLPLRVLGGYADFCRSSKGRVPMLVASAAGLAYPPGA